MPQTLIVDYRKQTLIGGQELVGVHVPTKDCYLQHCAVHWPSDHHMKDWPQNWQGRLLERICEHGIAHPDPDDIAFRRRMLGDDAAIPLMYHSCDGCCRTTESPP